MLLATLIILDGCSSGKKAYENGNYDQAVLKSINRLRKSPNNKKATQTLSESYPLTISWHRDNISRAKASTDEFKWERVVKEYQQINFLYQELNRCPACLRIVSNPVSYQAELNDARQKAASIRYHKGDELLGRARENHDRYEAREAFQHFEVACQLMGDYQDARDKMAEAKFLATLKVVVEPIPVHSRNLAISNEFFENKILEFLETMPVNEFVRFYSFVEAKNIGLTEPDQIIQLQFDDFVLGQVYLKEKEIQMSRDSVVLAVIKAENKVETQDALAMVTPNSDLSSLVKLEGPVITAAELNNVAGKNDKVTICHKIPASLGKTTTITVSENALQHHLDHGDVQGVCEGETDPQSQPSESSGSADTDNSNSNGTNNSPSGGTDQNNSSDAESGNSGTDNSEQSQGTSESGSESSSGTESGTTTNQGGNQEQETTQKVYGTVKATMHVFNKTLTSSGLMDFKIIEFHSKRVLTQEKMPGEFIWYTEWGYFNGDERALDQYFKEIVKLKEAPPPAPQDLFVAFTQPIYGQITRKIQDFYRTY